MLLYIYLGGSCYTKDDKLDTGKKLAYESFLALLEAVLLKNTESFIPTTILCSFLKKLSRLSLMATMNFHLWFIPFLFNIFRKYRQNILFIIHNETQISFQNDPFSMSEVNPLLTSAESSFLWELQLLMLHYFPKVPALKEILHENFNGRLAFPLEKFSKKQNTFYITETIKNCLEEQQGYSQWLLRDPIPHDFFSL